MSPPPEGLMQPPTNLSYTNLSTIATQNQATVPNVPSSSGGAVSSYSVSSVLPAGLTLDTTTGVISGAPTVISDSQTYTITASNTAGFATIDLSIGVSAQLQPPTNLSYLTLSIAATQNQAIVSNLPNSSGGAVTSYSVSPALPAGLTLNTASGLISGTPIVASTSQTYTVTASNNAGYTSCTLDVAVAAQNLAPKGLTYSNTSPIYTQNLTITPNMPSNGGGKLTNYSVSPALPAGLALDPLSGIISGKPTVLAAQAPYVVTGSNSLEFTQATLQIAVKLPPTPTYVIGDPLVVPFPPVGGVASSTFFFNDSAFPYLKSADGTKMIAFFGIYLPANNASIYRYEGPDLLHLQPTGAIKVTRAAGVDADPDTAYDRNGIWMETATRTADGTLVANVHAENHYFIGGGTGEWDSGGIMTSVDDGVSWTNWGPFIGSTKPDKAAFGGLDARTLIWDAVNSRWLAYAQNMPFVSYDPHAMPGTWYGKDSKGDFTQKVNPAANQVFPVASGALGNKPNFGGFTWNTYLNEYIYTWIPYGNKTDIQAAFSQDGITWSAPVLLYRASAEESYLNYPQLIGDSDTQSGQDAYLVYMKGPSTGPNNNDMISRPIHFEKSW